MAATPKAKPTPVRGAAARADRTSTVVTATLILLTALGVLTVFWEPLAALAGGAPAADVASESRVPAADAGAGAASAPSVTGAAGPGSAPLDASGSS
jgi:hypothetical protein